MNKLVRSTVALSVIMAGAAIAQAQLSKPILVVALPSYNDIVANADFIGQLAGQAGAGAKMEAAVQFMTQGQGLKGLDKTKPFGLVVTSDGSSPTPAVFLPVTSAKELIDTLVAMHVVGPPQDDGGVMKMTVPNSGDDIFVREQSGWAFATMTKDSQLPSDPMKTLGSLTSEYDVAVRIFLQNVPADQKKAAIEKFKGFIQLAKAMQPKQQDNPLSAMSEKNLEQSLEQIERLVNEADQITIGWKLDRSAKNTHFDLTFTAVPGSSLEKEMQQLSKARTNFAGFQMPEAAITANLCSVSSPEEIKQTSDAIEQLKTKMAEFIDNDENLADRAVEQLKQNLKREPSNEEREKEVERVRSQVKSVYAQFLDVVLKTVKTGKSDGGGVVVLGADKFQAAAGFAIADGPGLEAAVKSLVELAKGEPKFNEVATVKFDLATHGDVKFHQINVKLPPAADEDAKKIFGDSIEVYVGVGANSAYFGLGKGSMDLLNSVIDRSAAEQNKPVSPFSMSIALGPICRFAASMNQGDPKTAAMVQLFDMAKGKDHILVNVKTIPNGVTYRVEVESGILEALGQMSKMAMHRGGAQGGFGG